MIAFMIYPPDVQKQSSNGLLKMIERDINGDTNLEHSIAWRLWRKLRIPLGKIKDLTTVIAHPTARYEAYGSAIHIRKLQTDRAVRNF